MTFVAALDFDRFRPLARYLLATLADAQPGISIDDPPDPLKEVEDQRSVSTQATNKAPRLSDTIWRGWLDAHGGDRDGARAALDHRVRREGQKIVNTASMDDFRHELTAQLSRAEKQGRGHIEINAGELHRIVAVEHNRLPMACNALKQVQRRGDEVVFTPPSGEGASFTVRYR